MADDVTVTVTIRGLANPDVAANAVVNFIRRALYYVDGIPGEFSSVIECQRLGIRLEVPEGEGRGTGFEPAHSD